MRIGRVGLACALGLVLLAPTAQAGNIEVQVGYADNLRASPFFPVPWDGGTNVALFAGGQTAGYDAGAIRIINNGVSAFTINDLTVNGFGDGSSYHIWSGFLGAGFVLDPGKSAIFTQTSSYNFDTSDNQGGNPNATPNVIFTINGVLQAALVDTAQVLNTEGTDHLPPLNESHQWRDIGTFGGQAGATPEPSTLALAGIGGLVGLARRWKARRRAA